MLVLSKELEKYIISHTSPEDALLSELTRRTHLQVVQPRMLSGHYQGKILEMFSCMLRPRTILEIGTFTGYSALCLAKGLQDGGELHTIEKNDELEELALSFFAQLEYKNRIHFHLGDALEIAPTLEKQFDLIFIDGDKREYPKYYEMALTMLDDNGFILADNVLWDGKVVEEVKSNDLYTKEIVEFNNLVQSDLRVKNVLLPFRDGMMIIWKNSPQM